MTFSSSTQPEWTPQIPELGTFRQCSESIIQKDPKLETAPEGTTLFTLLQSLLAHLNCISTNKQQQTVWFWSAKNGTYMRSQHWAKYHIKGIKSHDTAEITAYLPTMRKQPKFLKPLSASQVAIWKNWEKEVFRIQSAQKTSVQIEGNSTINKTQDKAWYTLNIRRSLTISTFSSIKSDNL